MHEKRRRRTSIRSAGETTIDSWLVYRAADGLMVLPPGSGEPIQLAPAPIYQWEASTAGGESRTLWIGAFNATAFAPTTGHALLSIDAGVGPCNPAAVRGLLITHPQAQDSFIVHDTAVETTQDLDWSPPLDAFLAATETVLTITPDEETSPLPSPLAIVPTISPDGAWAAWAGEGGLWAGRVGEEAPQVYGDAAFLPRWTPGGSLLFFGADGLYLAPPPDFAPTLIVPGAQARDAVLLGVP